MTKRYAETVFQCICNYHIETRLLVNGKICLKNAIWAQNTMINRIMKKLLWRINWTMTTTWNYNLDLVVHTGTQEHTGAYSDFLRLQEIDWIHGKKTGILCAVRGDEWAIPIDQFTQGEQITQSLLTYLLDIETRDCLIYSNIFQNQNIILT